MKKLFLIISVIAVALAVYGNATKQSVATEQVEVAPDSDTVLVDTVVLVDDSGYYEGVDSVATLSFNDIRFADWTDADWLDNDYIRTLRKYLDDYYAGKIEEPDLDPYKEYTKSKFIIGNIQPAYIGGVFIQFTFLDLPNRVFTGWIYSYVDEDVMAVTGYELRGINIEEDILDMTKEDILSIVKEHPELKLW